MKLKIISVIIVLGVILIIGSNYVTNSTTALKVGVILPLTGQYAAVGTNVKQAMEMAVASSSDIKLLFEDDMYDAKNALSAYQKLVSIDGAEIIVSLGSPTVEILKPEVEKSGKLMFILGEELSHDIDHTYQIMPQSAVLFKVLGAESSKRFKSVSVVYATDNNLFKNNHRLFLDGISSTTKIFDLPLTSASDARTEVSKILANKADAFTLFTSLETGIKVLKEMAKYPSSPQLICDMNIEITLSQFLESVDPKNLNNCISVALVNTQDQNFAELYKKTFNTNLVFGEDYGYDAVRIIQQLSKLDKDNWMNYLNSLKVTGVSGEITFDKAGARSSVSEIHIFKDGKFVKLEE